MKKEDIKKAVRERYGERAQGESCSCSSLSCCGTPNPAEAISKHIGYSEEDLASVPEGSNLGLGCGNPVALASLREGETVLDLGAGAGFDCFLAANRVGKSGRVIGVDMTPAMLDKARENARGSGYDNVEFRLGEIENIPAADNSVDVIISNCVINLSPDKPKVFADTYRVIRPGGRLLVSDIVLLKPLPEFVRNSIEAYVGCVAGAMIRDEYLATIEAAGFTDVTVAGESKFPTELLANDPTVRAVIESLNVPMEELADVADSIVSIKVQATKPA